MKANLKAIGIEVEVRPFPPVLNSLLGGTGIKTRDNSNLAYFNDPVYNRGLRAAARLTAPERYRVYGALDVDLARNAAPLVAIANYTTRDFFSARIGCQLHQPVYGIDLAALCLRRSAG